MDLNLNDLLGDLYDDGRKKITVESFDELIEKLELKPDYQIFLDSDNDIIINEEWSSPINSDVRANRIYKFDPDFIYLIPDVDRIPVLQEVLKLCIKNEYYEMAAIIRDLVNDFQMSN